jgi:AraC-like DNA-binding protein
MTDSGRAGAPPVRKRFQAFHYAIRDTFVLVPVALSAVDVTAFHGRVMSATVGDLQLSKVGVSEDVVVRRTPELIKRAVSDNLKVVVQLSGRCVVSQEGREAILTPGDYAIYDTTRPYTLAVSGVNQILVVMFPRKMLRLPPQTLSGLTARRFRRQDGLAASVSPFLVELGSRLNSVNHAGELHLADAVTSMLASSFAERLSEAGVIEIGGNGLRLRVCAFIEQRLADPGLTVSTLAAAHHISVRYLQKLFEAEGETVTGWIRARRIEHCRRELADPQFATLPVGSIAARWGLPSAPHFSRLFKSVHGLSPTEYRAQALSRSHEIARPRATTFDTSSIATNGHLDPQPTMPRSSRHPLVLRASSKKCGERLDHTAPGAAELS